MRHHLAVLHRLHLNEILSGRKTVECRLGQIGYLPYGCVQGGDLIWLKEASGPVQAVASAAAVQTLQPLTPDLLDWVRRQFNDRIRAPAGFWHNGRRATAATLVWLEDVCPLRPFQVAKHDRRAWVPLAQPPVPGKPIAAEASPKRST